MHEITYYFATIWMTFLLCVCMALVIRTKSGMVRILAFDALTLVLVALLIIYSISTETSYYLDAALVLSLLSFVSTVVASRYYSERRVF
jgi:multisubunit Na+/H+ antiporter MnhF subunit